MRYLMEAATDAASLILFDPAALPADFERQFQDEPIGTLDRLTRFGYAFCLNTGRDGSYRLHAYVDEPIPSSLWDSVYDPRCVTDFQVPSGRLWFTGSECAFHDDPSFLEKHPHLGSSLAIQPGTYHLTIYRTAYPDGFLETQFKDSVSPWEYRLWTSQTVLVPLALAAWTGLILIYFTTARVPSHHYPSFVLALIFSLPFAVRISGAYRALKARYASMEQEFPALVARLMIRGPAGLG
jgi:hypothetical protein